jgi:hypothetical protein
MTHPPYSLSPRHLWVTAFCASALLVAGCNKSPNVPAASAPAADQQPALAPPVAAAPTLASALPPYMPPGAEQLYQMVAPIALYPDKLVAQVLAGSTYPDEITAADQWLGQNTALKAGPLADAADQHPWDPSIKSLTAFRRVLDQMASNLPWTTALGQAYYNDPADVMNAIQVMRQRASKAGKLKNTQQLRVASGSGPATGYSPGPTTEVRYAGPIVVEPPPQYITIEPAQPDVVYVPHYDPRDIYGEPVAVYPGYAYAAPVYAEPRYSNAQIAKAGVLTFGTGVIVGAALERHDWGWNAWGMNWGRPDAYRGSNRPPQGDRGFDRPAVVYNHNMYVSRTQETIINNNVRNNFIDNARPQQAREQAQLDQLRRQQDQMQQAQQAQQGFSSQQQAQRVQQEQMQRQQQQLQAQQVQSQAQAALIQQQDQARRQQMQQAQMQQQQAREQQQVQAIEQQQQVQRQQQAIAQQQQAIAQQQAQQKAQQQQAIAQQQAQQKAQQQQAIAQQQAQEKAQQQQAIAQQQAQEKAQQQAQQKAQQQQAIAQQQAQQKAQQMAQEQQRRAQEQQARPVGEKKRPSVDRPQDEPNH